MSEIKIHPLNLGTLTRPKVLFHYNFSELFNMIEVPVIAWYIEGADKKVLVDTGGVDPEQMTHLAPYAREADQTIDQALKKIGVECSDIELVINTHLHWDHIGGNSYFPNAEFVVQKLEYEMSQNPPPVYAGAFLNDVIENTRFTFVEGEQEIIRDISVIPVPGHTEGIQGVLVKAASTDYFICGDAMGLYENLETEPMASSGVFVNLRDSYASIDKIKALNAVALPGHDIKVFDKAVYD